MRKFVTGRIREIAETVGARVSDDEKCTPNIEIVFTTAPQALLDSVRQEHPSYLGYYDNQSQAQKLAMVTHPIQSWYTTATGDLTGEPQVDGGKKQGVEFQATSMTVTAPGGLGLAPSMQTFSMPSATARSTSGSRNSDGLSSEFFHVLIVAEPAKLLDHDVGTLADYVAVLALSQPGSLDACEAAQHHQPSGAGLHHHRPHRYRWRPGLPARPLQDVADFDPAGPAQRDALPDGKDPGDGQEMRTQILTIGLAGSNT